MRVSQQVYQRSGLALLTAFILVAAACGSSSKSSSTTSAATSVTTSAGTTATTAATATTSAGTSGTTAASTASTAGGASSTTAAGTGTGTAGCPAIDTSVDADPVNGKGTGRFISDIECTESKPLKATGDPITIGFQNPEGDPSGSFPESSLGAQAAVDYINNELGGLGADIQNGKPGRPIRLEVCKMAISPDDSQRCANDLIAKSPALVVNGFNFFGNHLAIYKAAKMPVIVTQPITVADFSTPGVWAIGGGGGCVGAFPALVSYSVDQLKGKRVVAAWADTPPGVVCYYDLTAKPMDVLAGKVTGTSKLAGTMPDLKYLGVPIKPASPDLTAQVTQILDFKPDVILSSIQSSDCWNLVASLGRLGWTPQKIPLVFGGSCIDNAAATAAGDLAKGIYFLTAGSSSLINDPATITDPRGKLEAQIYQAKLAKYGVSPAMVTMGTTGIGFTSFLSIWERASAIAVAGGTVTGASISDSYGATDGEHQFGTSPLACAKAVAPYVTICNSDAVMSQWDGTQLVPVSKVYSGVGLLAGTPIKPGP